MKLKVKKALHNNVLVKIIEEHNQQMRGSIYIPENSSEKSSKIGKVLKVGPGAISFSGERISTEIQVDDIVVLPNFGGQNFKLNGEEFVIIKETDILLTLEDDNII